MTALPHQRVQCDTCRSVVVLTAPRSTQWGEELCGLGWRARLIRGSYRHACPDCADELLAAFEGRPTRSADRTERADDG